MLNHLLARKRIVITRADTQAEGMIAALQSVGAQPILFPTIHIAGITPNPALDAVVNRQADHPYDWIVFTSANGVRVVLDYWKARGLTSAMLKPSKIAAIGPATAHALFKHGVQCDLIPHEFVAESLAEAMIAAGSLVGQRCLLLRAESVRPILAELLTAHGAIVESVTVYLTELGTPDAQAYADLRAGVDMLTFTSASTVRHFVQLLGAEAYAIAERSTLACIGPVTAQAARSLGLPVDIVAKTYTIAGLLQALEEYQPQ